jgi:secreted trypsin-like serine protease
MKPSKSSSNLLQIFINFQAAHCIYDFNRITVMVGTINRIRGPFAFQAEITSTRHIIPHHGYNPSTLENDVGLIFMVTASESILHHSHIATIALPLQSDASTNLVGRISTASGFGATEDGANRQPSDVLRFVSMPVMSNVQCRQTFGAFILESNLCVDTVGGFSPCVGDSGEKKLRWFEVVL